MVPDEFVERAKAIIEAVRKDFRIEESEVRNQNSEDKSQNSE
jgi:hypothetical protein